jgi:hypothetical protein
MESLWERRGPAAAIIVAALFFIAPLWCVSSPAMPDFPAHLASYYLIGAGNGASPFYSLEWAFIPNLAAEIGVPFLAHFMALDAAARLFLSLGVAMWVIGPRSSTARFTGGSVLRRSPPRSSPTTRISCGDS